MSNVVFHSVAAAYEDALVATLRAAELEVTVLSSASEMAAAIRAGGVSAVVCNTQDGAVVEAVTALMKVPAMQGCFPKTVFLSSLLAWGGTDYAGASIDASDGATLAARRPALGCLETFRLENMCRSVSAAKGVDASVIGVGSVYGGSGYDLEYIFRALWTDGMLKVETPLEGENYVPMVHVDALGALLLRRVSSGVGGTANTYVAAVDGYSGTIGSFLRSIAEAYDATVDFLPTRVKVIDDIMTSPANALWNQNMHFKSPAATADADPASGSTVDVRALWEEFLRGK